MKRSMNEVSARKGGMLRSLSVLVASSAMLVGMTGCDNALQGGATGAALGALAGMGLGSLTGNMGAGAAAGAIIGGLGGGILGDQNRRNSGGY